jgi:hypothetical protein
VYFRLLVEVFDRQRDLADIESCLAVVEPVDFAENSKALVAQIATFCVSCLCIVCSVVWLLVKFRGRGRVC